MRSLKYVAAMLAALGIGSLANAALVFNGNGASGFGGSVGSGSLSVTDDGTNINFSFTTPTAFTGNVLVLYVDSKPGGVNDTSTFTDTGSPAGSDAGRTATSGFGATSNPQTRTVATFVPGFGADFAITFEPGSFSGLFDLSTPANFGFVASGNLAGTGTGPFTFSYTRASLGLNATDPFSFEGTLISGSAYRSDETIGTSVTTPGTPGDAPNAGFGGTTVFSTANVVPEPASLALLGLVSLVGLRRRH